MSMFDYFRPAEELVCPICRRILLNWQGKDGPNGLFVWSQGTLFPIEQAVNEEVKIEKGARERLRLPPRFMIYSYDCPDHYPIEADCSTSDGVWSCTAIRPFAIERRR